MFYGWLTNQDHHTSLWTHCNSRLIPHDDNIQNIRQLPKIKQLSTSNAVVIETMRHSLAIAAEIGTNCMSVTYDLSIANKKLIALRFPQICLAPKNLKRLSEIT